jgi:hypothetical protein
MNPLGWLKRTARRNKDNLATVGAVAAATGNAKTATALSAISSLAGQQTPATEPGNGATMGITTETPTVLPLEPWQSSLKRLGYGAWYAALGILTAVTIQTLLASAIAPLPDNIEALVAPFTATIAAALYSAIGKYRTEVKKRAGDFAQ